MIKLAKHPDLSCSFLGRFRSFARELMPDRDRQAPIYVTSLLFAALMAERCNYFYEGTEFGGGSITGPLVKMNFVGGLLFLMALATGFWWKRLSATVVFIAGVVSFPLYIYLLCPRLFQIIFLEDYSPQGQHIFYWSKWPILGIISIFSAIYATCRNAFTNKAARAKILFVFVTLASVLCLQLAAQEIKNAPSLLIPIDVPNIGEDNKATDDKITQRIDTPQGEVGIRREQGLQVVYFKNKTLLKNDSTIFVAAYATRIEEKPSLFLIKSNCPGNACNGPDVYLVDVENGTPYISQALALAHDSRSILVSKIDSNTYKIYGEDAKAIPIAYLYDRDTHRIFMQPEKKDKTALRP